MTKNSKFPTFPKDCSSLLSKYLTKEVFELLKERKTNNGFSLQDVIKSGVENSDSGIGVYAGDELSYHTFAELFNPIIKEYHGFGVDDKHQSNLQIRGIDGEHSKSKGNIYDISNKRRLGVTEVQCVQDMVDGVRELIEVERCA